MATASTWQALPGNGVGVTASLATGLATGAGTDTLVSVENLAGSNFADSLVGSAEGNLLIGGLGNDTLSGGDGTDTLIGGAGADNLLGGLGNDLISYAASSAGVTVSILSGPNTGGDAAGDVLNSIEDVVGSAYADTITGNNFGNVLMGGDGADVLDGGSGNDTLVGGLGADTMIGGTTWYDVASYRDAASGVAASLLDEASNSGEATGDHYDLIENLEGSGYADMLTGDAAHNSLTGGGGADTLIGDAGDDVLEGGAGADSLVGGVRWDTASYEHAQSGLVASLANAALNTGEAAGDAYVLMEYLRGSAFGDTLEGHSGVNLLQGQAGDDSLMAGDGADTLDGGEGTTRSSAVRALTASSVATASTRRAGQPARPVWRWILLPVAARAAMRPATCWCRWRTSSAPAWATL